MLEYIKAPLSFGDTFVVAEVGGMGFRITATKNTIEKLKSQNNNTEAGHSRPQHVVALLMTYLHISENKWEIFGFAEKQEREAFLLLLSCRGVGTKAALNILSSLSPSRLRSIAQGREPVTVLQQVPGIGAKSADRILVELKEKLSEMGGWEGRNGEESEGSSQYSQDDLFQVLRNLGYRTQEIQAAISKVQDLPPTLSEAVKQILRELGKR